ncbi:MAG: carboxypeptidase-like regulatory domain-containing protein [Polyangia bacterium]
MKRPYSIFMYRALGLCLALSVGSLAGCSEGGKDNPNNNNNNNMNMTGDTDMAGAANVDMAGSMSGGDGGSMSTPDMTVLMGIPCIPGTYRCGAGLSVEICNSSGTAWLYSSTCAVSCMAGLCTGACEPGTKRCNGKNVESCNPAGSAWTVSESCSTFCDSARCAAPTLDVSSNKMLDGDQLVDGDIIIRTGATLTSPAGDLTLRTRGAILVEMGASIVVNPTGDSPDGHGGDGYSYSYYSGGGGGYGSNGSNGYAGGGGGTWGSLTDISIAPGSSGGKNGGGNLGGKGGGVLRLIAGKSITIAGQVTANGAGGTSGGGGGGGGSGGGILVATPDKIVVSGSITAAGGSGGMGSTSSYKGGDGGSGRVKLLNNGMRMVTGSINAVKTEGLLPPLTISSSSHPNQDLYYNDDFPAFQAAWTQAFAGLQGYYFAINNTSSRPPNPGNGGKAVAAETIMIPASDVRTGDNWFHIVPIDAMSNVGTVENTFRVRINSSPPSLSSSSHPTSSTWYSVQDVFFNWTFPYDDKNFKGIYYVLDRYGETIPNSMGTFIPVTQKQLLRMGLANGIWVLHMVPVDQRGYLTKTASHFRVQIGPDPGRGTLLGQVVDSMGKPVANAKVTVNRGLYSTTTNSMGSYNFMTTVPAGAWEIKGSSSDGLLNDVKMDTVTKDGTTTVNLTLK